MSRIRRAKGRARAGSRIFSAVFRTAYRPQVGAFLVQVQLVASWSPPPEAVVSSR